MSMLILNDGLKIIEAAGYGPAASIRVFGKIKTGAGQVSFIKRRIGCPVLLD